MDIAANAITAVLNDEWILKNYVDNAARKFRNVVISTLRP
jgi:hypothetical protein